MTPGDFESWLGQRLPEPYRAFLAATTESFLAVDDHTLVYGLDDVRERNETFETLEYCPGFVAIGDDSGGTAVVMSLASGRLHRVDMGVMTPDGFTALAPSFEAWQLRGFLTP